MTVFIPLFVFVRYGCKPSKVVANFFNLNKPYFELIEKDTFLHVYQLEFEEYNIIASEIHRGCFSLWGKYYPSYK